MNIGPHMAVSSAVGGVFDAANLVEVVVPRGPEGPQGYQQCRPHPPGGATRRPDRRLR